MDFGGSLGSTYFQNKDLLKQANIEIHWNVVEQEHFVRCGKEHFENDELKFSFSIKDVLKTQKINACLLSSVLQYLKNPFDLLDEIYENNIEYVIIDRTLSVENKNDVSTIQNVQKEIYEAKYPAWFFSIDKFIAYLQIKYSIIYKWDAFGNYALGKYNVKALGYLLKRK
jgi:putative methyltransferase (TIGR04325 family)